MNILKRLFQLEATQDALPKYVCFVDMYGNQRKMNLEELYRCCSQHITWAQWLHRFDHTVPYEYGVISILECNGIISQLLEYRKKSKNKTEKAFINHSIGSLIVIRDGCCIVAKADGKYDMWPEDGSIYREAMENLKVDNDGGFSIMRQRHTYRSDGSGDYDVAFDGSKNCITPEIPYMFLVNLRALKFHEEHIINREEGEIRA
jgi:hypothetical protein